jgi:CRP-like cAMP-binding protein
MNKFLEKDMETELFSGIEPEALRVTLACLGARVRAYKKDDIILLAGDPAENVGIVLEGQVTVSRQDYYGGSHMLARLGRGELFSEVFVCAGVPRSPVTVSSDGESEILFISFGRIKNCCSNACGAHSSLIENMLGILARKAMAQNFKIELLSERSIRGRLEAYLMSVMKERGAGTFDIPFSRHELADFLRVDRSALSNELSKMRDEGLIRFDKNRFEILASLSRD